MTQREILYDIMNTPNGGLTPNEFGYDESQVIKWIDTHAAFLRSRDINQKGFIDDSLVQDLGCQTLTKVDAADCDIKWGTDIKKLDIPATLQLASKKIGALVFVGFIDKVTPIQLKPQEQMYLNQHSQYKSNLGLVCFQIGNTLYFHGANAVNLCYVNVRGVFETPTIVRTCASPTADEECFDLDCQYPICEILIPELKERIWNLEMRVGGINLDAQPNNTEVKLT